MERQPDVGGLSTVTRRRSGDTTYDVFYEIETHCKTHHFTIFYGNIEEQGRPQAVWDREEDPLWESFLSIAKSVDVRTVYLIVPSSQATKFSRFAHGYGALILRR
jgi:hypothetical protein